MSTESDSDSSRLSDAEADWTMVKRSEVVQGSDEDSDIVRIGDEEEELSVPYQYHPSETAAVAQPDEQLAQPEEQPVQSEEQPAQSEEQLAQIEEQLAQPDEQPAQPEEQVAQPKELVQPEEQLAQPKEQPAQPKEQLAQREEQLAQPDERIHVAPAYESLSNIPLTPAISNEPSAADASLDPKAVIAGLRSAACADPDQINFLKSPHMAFLRYCWNLGDNSAESEHSFADFEMPEDDLSEDELREPYELPEDAIIRCDVDKAKDPHRITALRHPDSGDACTQLSAAVESEACHFKAADKARLDNDDSLKHGVESDSTNLSTDVNLQSLPQLRSEEVNPVGAESVETVAEKLNVDEQMEGAPEEKVSVAELRRHYQECVSSDGCAQSDTCLCECSLPCLNSVSKASETADMLQKNRKHERLVFHITVLMTIVFFCLCFFFLCLIIKTGKYRMKTAVESAIRRQGALTAVDNEADLLENSVQQLFLQQTAPWDDHDQNPVLLAVSKIWRSKYGELVEEKANLEYQLNSVQAEIHALKLRSNSLLDPTAPGDKRLQRQEYTELSKVKSLRNENNELKQENYELKAQILSQRYSKHPGNGQRGWDDGQKLMTEEEKEEEESHEEMQSLARQIQAAVSNKIKAADLLVSLQLQLNTSVPDLCRAVDRKRSSTATLDRQEDATVAELLAVCGLNKTAEHPQSEHAFKRYVDRFLSKLGRAVRSTIRSTKKLSNKVMGQESFRLPHYDIASKVKNTFKKLSAKVATKWEQVMDTLANWKWVKGSQMDKGREGKDSQACGNGGETRDKALDLKSEINLKKKKVQPALSSPKQKHGQIPNEAASEWGLSGRSEWIKPVPGILRKEQQHHRHAEFFQGSPRWFLQEHGRHLQLLQHRLETMHDTALEGLSEDHIEMILSEVTGLVCDFFQHLDSPEMIKSWLNCQQVWWKHLVERKPFGGGFLPLCRQQLLSWQVKKLCKLSKKADERFGKDDVKMCRPAMVASDVGSRKEMESDPLLRLDDAQYRDFALRYNKIIAGRGASKTASDVKQSSGTKTSLDDDDWAKIEVPSGRKNSALASPVGDTKPRWFFQHSVFRFDWHQHASVFQRPMNEKKDVGQDEEKEVKGTRLPKLHRRL